MMKDQRSFPARIRTHRDVYTLLDLYAWCTSIEVTTQQASLLAATLANGGVNPLTGAVVFHPKHVRNALSIMATAGMYNFSGEYAFHMGLPAKSSSTGTLLICVPNVMGICASCPMSDEHWIPVTATRFCFRLCRLYSLHVYEPHENRQKYNPKNPPDFNTHRIVALHFAAADNDIFTVLRKLMQGVDINARDALGRTALHVAVANGSSNVVAVLLRLNADITARDLEGRCVDGLLPGSPDRDREIQQQQPQQQQQQVVLSPHSPSPQQSGAESGAESEGEDVNRMTCVRLVREEWRRRQENQMWRQRLSVGRMDMTQHYYR
jgi:glutaminase